MRRLVLPVILFVAFVQRTAAQQEMELEDILYLSESGMSEEQICKEIRSRRVKFRLTAEIEAQLQKKGLSDTLVRILREVQLVDDVVRMKTEGKSDIEIIREIAGAGLVLNLGSDDLMLFRRKKISIDIVNALQGNFTFQDLTTHEHPGGFFRVQYPGNWHRIEEFEDDKAIVTFTPVDRPTSKSLESGFRIEMTVTGGDSPHRRMPLAAINRNRMRQLASEMKEKGAFFETRGDPKKTSHLGVEGAMNEYDYTVGNVRVRRRALLLYHTGIEYLVAYDVPIPNLDAMIPTMEKMLLTFNPAPGEIGRKVRKETANSQKLREKYRASIVKVEVTFKENGQVVAGGWGTGWFIRRDGYLLTNHHVVWSEELRRYADEIVLHWEDTLQRQPVPAKLIDAVRSEFPAVDVALIKAKGTDYEPLPVIRVNPPGKYVLEQDHVMVLGFPGIVEENRRGMPLTLTITEGKIIKFDLRPDHSINKVMHDAVSSGGNSGGPCFDLETHSVIGLHTMSLVEGNARSAYKGVIPVDAAFENFPEIISYPESVDVKFRGEDHLALAIQFHTQGLHRAALRQLGRAFSKKLSVKGREGLMDAVELVSGALKLGSEFPDGFAAAGEILSHFNAIDLAQQCYEAALHQDPDNARALRGLALIAPKRALECTNHLVRLRPRDHSAYLARAQVHENQGRIDEAIADAKMSAECCAEMYAEPYCTLGRLNYARKNFEEGRAQYEKAVQIDPKSVEARFGVARYFHIQRKFPETRKYIDSIANDGRDDALWQRLSGDYLFTIAGAYQQAKDPDTADSFYDGAFGYYDRAVSLYRNWNQLAGTETLIRFGWLALAKKQNHELALTTYTTLTRMLIDVKDGKRVNDPWLQNCYANLGFACRGLKAEWLSGAFFQAAVNLDGSSNDGKLSQQQLGGKQRVPLTQDHLVLLLSRVNFSDFTVADLVLASPLAFKINPADADTLAKKGWPIAVLQALLKVSQAQGSGDSQGQGGEAKGPEAILKDWLAKDKQQLQAAQKIRYEDRHVLFKRYYDAHDRKDYRTSVPGFRLLFYRFYKDDQAMAASAAYNACCGYSLTSQKEEAIDWFELCFYYGWFQSQNDNVAHVNQDRDLDNIRNERRFKIVLEAARKLRQQGGQGTQNDNTPTVTLGVKLQNLTNTDRQNMGLKAGVGVLIVSVTADGPAARVGIAAGDVLCKLDADIVGDVNTYNSMLAKKQAGTKVKILIMRGKEFLSGEVELVAARP